VPDEENAADFSPMHYYGHKKLWRRQNCAEGEARTRFFVAQNARTGHFAVTVCYVLFVHFLMLYFFLLKMSIVLHEYFQILLRLTF
jgi:hypothetical protein